MKKVLYSLLVCGVLATTGLAQPAQISLQGMLTDTTGNPLTGPVELTFRLFPEAVGGTQFFAETHPAVPLSNGVYNVSLGSISTTLADKDFSREVYLGMQINGGTELQPRTLLTASPAAMTLVVPAEVVGTVTNNPVLLVQNEASSGSNQAILAQNTSDAGRAVYGQAVHPTGSNYGVYGYTSSQNGTGIRGYAGATSGSTVGVSGESKSSSGTGGDFIGATGVHAAGSVYGVWGETASGTGFGLVGMATSETGYNSGIWGKSNSVNGRGIQGEASATSGESVGVLGTSASSNGSGVKGVVSNSVATAKAIHGQASGTSFPGYFSGGRGVYIYPRLGVNQATPQHPIHVGAPLSDGGGAHLTKGGTWTDGSSRTFKQNLRSVSGAEVLNRVAALPIYRWEYRGSDEGDHLGPVAEDFYEAFRLGKDERYISGVDGDGVALAAIQGLYQMVLELQKENEVLRARLDQLER